MVHVQDRVEPWGVRSVVFRTEQFCLIRLTMWGRFRAADWLLNQTVPATDLDIIHAELRAKDIEWCQKIIEGFKKMRQVGAGVASTHRHVFRACKGTEWCETFIEGLKKMRCGRWGTAWLRLLQRGFHCRSVVFCLAQGC